MVSAQNTTDFDEFVDTNKAIDFQDLKQWEAAGEMGSQRTLILDEIYQSAEKKIQINLK